MLDELLTPTTIRNLAPQRAFSRGESYARGGAVAAITEGDGRIQAFVQGQRTHDVALWAEGARVQWRCSCPMGAAGEFCKHCVAVALAWTGQVTPDEDDPQGASKPRAKRGARKEADLRAFLKSQPAEVLADLLFQLAGEHKEVARFLSLRAALAGRGAKEPAKEVGQLLVKAIRTRRFLEYREVPGHARRINEAIDALEALSADKGNADSIADACVASLKALAKVLYGMSDDSDGELAGCQERLVELHLACCQVAPPDPLKLATTLVSLVTDDGVDAFCEAPEDYAEVLGESGQARVLELVEFEVDLLDECERAGRWGLARNLRCMAESVFRARGDKDGLIAFKARQAVDAHDCAEVAKLCAGVGRADEVIPWLERALAVAQHHEGGWVLEQMVDAHADRGDLAKAEALCWERLERELDDRAWAMTKKLALRLGRWDEWCPRALDTLKAGAFQKPKPTRDHYPISSPAKGAYVQALLEEGMVDDAWVACNALDCYGSVREEIVRRRAEAHPSDAIDHFRAKLKRNLQPTGEHAYRCVVADLRELKPLMERTGQLPEFLAIVATIRETYARRRTLIKLLDESGLDKG